VPGSSSSRFRLPGDLGLGDSFFLNMANIREERY
jgi:hypothetical protein